MFGSSHFGNFVFLYFEEKCLFTFFKSTHFARQVGKDGKLKNEQTEHIVKKITQLYDQSIASTKTKYIKLNTKTQIFFNNIRLLYTL